MVGGALDIAIEPTIPVWDLTALILIVEEAGIDFPISMAEAVLPGGAHCRPTGSFMTRYSNLIGGRRPVGARPGRERYRASR